MVGKPRGFAAMSPERLKEISRMGAKAAHAKGTAYEWNSEQAREAGRKGGAVSKRRKQFVGYDSGGDILPDGSHVDPRENKRKRVGNGS